MLKRLKKITAQIGFIYKSLFQVEGTPDPRWWHRCGIESQGAALMFAYRVRGKEVRISDAAQDLGVVTRRRVRPVTNKAT